MECNLQVNVGSINEEEHQRGIAHLVEHCVFLGIVFDWCVNTI